MFTASSSIEGIGRQRVEPSFLPDRMVSVPDAASIAAAPRYTDTYFCGEWVAAQGLDPSERCGAWE
ncbi:cysteine synthase [Mycobacterium xenopi RIVM700367]|nr:cysteine synthase [Mycobacterium xenopi RIVM700367]